VLRVILVDNVFDNLVCIIRLELPSLILYTYSTALPKRDIGIGIMNGRHAAIGVDLEESLLLEVLEANSLNLMRDIKKAQDHGNLGRVRSGLAVDLDRLKIGRHVE
jgi:hypothetical protein